MKYYTYIFHLIVVITHTILGKSHSQYRALTMAHMFAKNELIKNKIKLDNLLKKKKCIITINTNKTL